MDALDRLNTWKSVRKRNRRRRGPLFKKLTVIALGLGLVGLVVLFFFTKPSYDKAKAFDLESISRVEEASVIYDRFDQPVNRIFVEEANRLSVELSEVPDHLIDALISVEDSRFRKHSGVDLIGIARAVWLNLKAFRLTQGASTITQQLAKQGFAIKEPETIQDRTIKAKLAEAFLARRLEKRYSKDEILHMYLNRIFFGRGFYGINAAAKGYFDKHVSKLNLAESATICGLIKNPYLMDPIRFPERSKERGRNYVLERMVKEKKLDSGEAARLQALPLGMNPAPPLSKTRSTYVYDYVKQWFINEVGKEKARLGGYKIYTTIDMEMQAAMQTAMQKRLLEVENRATKIATENGAVPHQTHAQFDRLRAEKLAAEEKVPVPTYLQGAGILVDNDGGVVALVGGRDFYHSTYNRAAYTTRNAGGAFTPLVFATAFANGDFPGSIVSDEGIDNRYVMIGHDEGVLGEWNTENLSNRYEGAITARKALVFGKNAASARIGMRPGLEEVIKLAMRAGIKKPFQKVREQLKKEDVSLAEYADALKAKTYLGRLEVTVAEMALAYLTFPNYGERPGALHTIRRIEEHDGAVVYEVPEAKTAMVEVIPELAAFQTHSAMEDVLTVGTGREANAMGLKVFETIAGKTGTSYDSHDAWFCGYTSELTCAVWVGFDKHVEIYPNAFSREIAMPVWIDVMNATHGKYPAEFMPPPDHTKLVEICTVTGKTATDACYERVVREGDPTPMYQRCTQVEHVALDHASGDRCTLHETIPDIAKIHRTGAAAAVRVVTSLAGDAKPIRLLGDPIIGTDPYTAVIPPKLKVDPKAAEATPAPKAVTVRPAGWDEDSNLPLSLAPPKRLEFD